jgi:hypothetical protein
MHVGDFIPADRGRPASLQWIPEARTFIKTLPDGNIPFLFVRHNSRRPPTSPGG